METETLLKIKELILQIKAISKEIIVLQKRRDKLLRDVKLIIPIKVKLVQ